MIKGAAADAAGVRQGDELLAIDGAPTAALSPFQAAGLLQGAGAAEPAPSVQLQVGGLFALLQRGHAARLCLSCGCCRLQAQGLALLVP
jgi:hypothetical protein